MIEVPQAIKWILRLIRFVSWKNREPNKRSLNALGAKIGVFLLTLILISCRPEPGAIAFPHADPRRLDIGKGFPEGHPGAVGAGFLFFGRALVDLPPAVR